MTLEEINALTLDDVFEEVLLRLVDFGGIGSEIKYIFADGDDPKYNRLILNSTLTKPSLDLFESEFLVYQESLRLELAAWEAEQALLEQKEADRDDIRSRLIIINNKIIPLAIFRVSGFNGNYKEFLKQLIEDVDFITLEAIEAQIIVIEAEMAAQEQVEVDDQSEQDILKTWIDIFKAGNATNAQAQKAIAYLLKRL